MLTHNAIFSSNATHRHMQNSCSPAKLLFKCIKLYSTRQNSRSFIIICKALVHVPNSYSHAKKSCENDILSRSCSPADIIWKCQISCSHAKLIWFNFFPSVQWLPASLVSICLALRKYRTCLQLGRLEKNKKISVLQSRPTENHALQQSSNYSPTF